MVDIAWKLSNKERNSAPPLRITKGAPIFWDRLHHSNQAKIRFMLWLLAFDRHCRLRGNMEDFKAYLLSRHVTTEKQAAFYLHWVVQFFGHCKKEPGDRIETEDIDQYLRFLSKRKEDWQVKQAEEAIQLYLFFKNRNAKEGSAPSADKDRQWRAAAEDMHRMFRLKHLSLRTEKSYMGWVRRFYRFVEGQFPQSLGSVHVKDFMTHLAVDRKVSASTQNQAFNAILFLFSLDFAI